MKTHSKKNAPLLVLNRLTITCVLLRRILFRTRPIHYLVCIFTKLNISIFRNKKHQDSNTVLDFFLIRFCGNSPPISGESSLRFCFAIFTTECVQLTHKYGVYKIWRWTPLLKDFLRSSTSIRDFFIWKFFPRGWFQNDAIFHVMANLLSLMNTNNRKDKSCYSNTGLKLIQFLKSQVKINQFCSQSVARSFQCRLVTRFSV